MPIIRFEPPTLSQTRHAPVLRECVARAQLPWPAAELVVCHIWDDEPMDMWIRVRGKGPVYLSFAPALMNAPGHAATVEKLFQQLLDRCSAAWNIAER